MYGGGRWRRPFRSLAGSRADSRLDVAFLTQKGTGPGELYGPQRRRRRSNVKTACVCARVLLDPEVRGWVGYAARLLPSIIAYSGATSLVRFLFPSGSRPHVGGLPRSRAGLCMAS